jgi:hypothetical protein
MIRTYFIRVFTALAAAACLVACGDGSGNLPETLFVYLEPEATGVHFQNEVNEAENRNVGTYDYMYNGGGVAIADLDNDGLPDLIFCGNDTPSRIYRNRGNMKFEDVTDKSGVKHSGWTTGITLVDINDDGRLDLYFSRSGPDFATQSTTNLLYLNQGNFVFTERAQQYGIADNGLSTQAAFFDYDSDGDLDLIVVNHAVRNWANLSVDWLKYVESRPDKERNRFSPTLYRNNDNGSFTDVTSEAGLSGVAFGLGLAISDFDDDGRPDIFIANDYFIPDRLYLNQGNGRFNEMAKRKFRHTSFFSMGCDAADFNNDGLIDLVEPDMSPNDHYRSKMLMAGMDTAEFRFLERLGYTPQYMFNALYKNSGNGVMSDIAHLAGVARTDWSWAPLLADLDNDGFKDLIISNGIYRDITNNDWRTLLLNEMKAGTLTQTRYLELLQQAPRTPVVNAAFRNTGNLVFEAQADAWGLTAPSFSNGMATGDLDGDGDLDIVVNNLGQKAFVIENSASDRGAGFIRFKLEAPTEQMPLQGARLTVWMNNIQQMAENRFTRGFQSFSEPVVHFGLGVDPPPTIDSLTVLWPNGRISTYTALETNRVHTIRYDGTQLRRPAEKSKLKPYWDISDLAILPPAVHAENVYDDFRVEQLLPHRTSTMGPALAVGDVNGDGLDDFFLGGAKGLEAQLYLQTANGYFERSTQAALTSARQGEDLNALLFDSDGDGDLDLYVARGGGGDVVGQPDLLQDLLFLNDGKGNFSRANVLPAMPVSTQALRAFDFDDDGDLDLFVGGRNEPGKYPLGTRSFLLENRAGVFVDITAERAPELLQPRCVTDAIWLENGLQGKANLVLVGEWMAPEVFVFGLNGRMLQLQNAPELTGLTGWWASVQALPHPDGVLLLLGNVGENNKFHPTPEKPLYIFADDFDDDGQLDIVLSKDDNGRRVPVRGLQCSSGQMPVIRERFASYDAFASAPLEAILGREDLTGTFSLNATTFSSGTVLVRSDGIGPFRPLPKEAQIAPIAGAVVMPQAADGRYDVIIAGNQFTTEVETTPYDAGKGLLMRYGTAGNDIQFEVVLPAVSGVFIPGDVRKATSIRVSSDQIPGIIAASNGRRVRILMQGD